MLTIEETLALHRRTRARYMRAAREARSDFLTGNFRSLPAVVQEYVTKKYAFFYFRVNARGALTSFVRHARAANRKLVVLKMFSRQLTRDIYNGYEPYGNELDHLLK